MDIKQQFSLKAYNTFGIDVMTPFFISVTSENELKEALSMSEFKDALVIGGGSNMLLTKDLDRPVIHIALKGMERQNIPMGDNEILLKVQGGENWHTFVMYCVQNNLGGVENLSLIPGNVGTAPIQNIGAYGVELKDVFYSCNTIHRESLEERVFLLEDCKFGYRDSIFKNKLKDQYVITSVTFKLTTTVHTIRTDYGAIYDTLKTKNIPAPTLKDVSDAVIQIRNSKLPDPSKLGNSGSFFKNPVIDQHTFTVLRTTYKDIPYYPIGSDQIKVPAGWLIEKAGFKGKRYGDAGVHDKQALVLVNYGGASGKEIWALALRIQKAVQSKFGLTITPEVNIF